LRISEQPTSHSAEFKPSVRHKESSIQVTYYVSLTVSLLISFVNQFINNYDK